MAQININIDDAKSFLASLENSREQLMQNIRRIRTSFDGNCEAWQGDSRSAFESSLDELLAGTERFVRSAEEDCERLKRVIAASEEIANCRINL